MPTMARRRYDEQVDSRAFVDASQPWCQFRPLNHLHAGELQPARVPMHLKVHDRRMVLVRELLRSGQRGEELGARRDMKQFSESVIREGVRSDSGFEQV